MTTLKVVPTDAQLPSIEVEPSFQDIAKTLDPDKIAEQLRHARTQLELTRHYPGRGTRAATRQGHAT